MIKLTLDDQYMEKCDEKILWLDYKNITKVVQTGSNIYVDDGLITLTVKEIGLVFFNLSFFFPTIPYCREQVS